MAMRRDSIQTREFLGLGMRMPDDPMISDETV
jgi:hypothetical protein